MASSGLAVRVAEGMVSDCSECVDWPSVLCIPILVKRPQGVSVFWIVFVRCCCREKKEGCCGATAKMWFVGSEAHLAWRSGKEAS